jgi:hypothetical protein
MSLPLPAKEGQQPDAAESSSSSSRLGHLIRIGRDHLNHVNLEWAPAEEEEQISEKDAMIERYALHGLGPPGSHLQLIGGSHDENNHFCASFILHPPGDHESSDHEPSDQAHNSARPAENTSEAPSQVKESVPIASDES